MKMRKQEMKENKDHQAGTCFEEAPCAEMMEEYSLGEQGIGSLGEEMMRTWAERCREGRKGPRKPPRRKTSETITRMEV